MTALSVVVPTRNRCQAVLRLVRSLSNQDAGGLQVVVVVEGSTDGTVEALRRSQAEWVEVIHHREPRGVAAARNAGLAAAEAPLVGFLDDDDLWAPERIGDALAALSAHPDAGWTACGAAYVTGDGAVTGLQPAPASGDVSAPLRRANVIPGGGSGVIARTDLVRSVGGFDTALTDLADWDLWLRMAAEAPLTAVDHYQIAYTMDDRSSSFTRPDRCLRELAELRSRHGFGQRGQPDIDPGSWAQWMSVQQWRAGDRAALAHLWWSEAVRTRRPLDVARAVGYLTLPKGTQRWLRRLMLDRTIRRLPVEQLRAVETWLAALGVEVSTS